MQERQNGQKKWLGGCPVGAIREIRRNEDGSVGEMFVGDFSITRHTFAEIIDEDKRAERKRINDEKEVGDEEIIWTIGDWLAQSHHGKGIMTIVVKTMVDWAVRNMNVHHIRALVGVGNIGSSRVFEKNGFTLLETVRDAYPLPEVKGGGRASFHVFEWTRNRT
ncbi:predicted protein [Uncinocarpus reesii 1704]|uniref:N-acetyltransferase domain-containing protein n=1 Tax=Uncinocarpus reesii (strain UAMH 1704) TaxID=336963 RepID=C4JY94_UNCRE|nr:uncharacterized protein UREG_07145 [Uncinocarpus reesii 1704]EEP82280.1 predicted protein [Uncinocarpus reesii 1704]